MRDESGDIQNIGRDASDSFDDEKKEKVGAKFEITHGTSCLSSDYPILSQGNPFARVSSRTADLVVDGTSSFSSFRQVPKVLHLVEQLTRGIFSK